MKGSSQVGIGLAVLALAACGSDTRSSTGFGDTGVWTGGENLAQGSDGTVEDGDVVAVLTVEAPASEEFLLTATVPVPAGTLTEGGLSVPLSVRNPDGVACPTQVEVVSRYPRWEDGADVVEVLAHVRRPEGVEPGDRFEVEVGHNPHARKELITGSLAADLLNSPGALKLVAHDAFGHRYSADLLDGWANADDDPEAVRASTTVLRDGQVARTVRTHRVLLPEEPVSGTQATLPHLFGVHAYTTAWRGRNILSLDLQVHNGMDGLDPTTSVDDALTDLVFEDLQLRTPPGWQVAALVENPLHGPAANAGGWRWHRLIRARSDGKLHWFPRQGRMIRRLVVFHPTEQEAALDLLRSRWRGFVAPAENADEVECWSWWNPRTARFLAQNARLPELDHLDMAGLRSQQGTRWGNLIQQVREGTEGSYPFLSPALGWAHPWGVAYGGMAGGDEIWPMDGVVAAWTGSQAAYRTAQLEARCYVDRQPQSLYDLQGRPTQVEDLLVSGAQGPYVKCWFFERPNPDSDPFGFGEAPKHQNEHAQNAGLVPPYKAELEDWMHIDHQHLIRYTRNLKTLAWLGNDALSKDLLLAATEAVRLSYHQYPLTPYYQVQNSQLYARMLYVDQNPGIGFDFRRSQSWGLDAAACAYALGDAATRETLLPWFELVVGLLRDGQSTCTGNVMSAGFSEFFYQTYRLRQTFEEAFMTTLLRSLSTTVFGEADPERAAMAEQILLASATCTITPPFWDPAANKPRFRMGVGPWDGAEGEFCFNVPSDAFTEHHDSLNPLPMMAWASMLSGDELFQGRASQMLGGGNLRTLLEAQGTQDLAQWAPLLALTQRPLPQ
jgi:hypothetical protein